MDSSQGDSRFINDVKRSVLVIPEADISKSPSLKRRVQKYQLEDLFTGTTNSPPASPRIRIKRSTVKAILGNKNSDKYESNIETSSKSHIPKNKTCAGNLSSITKRNDPVPPLAKSKSSPTLLQTNNHCQLSISEEVKKQNLKPISADTSVNTTGTNMSSAIHVGHAEKAAKSLTSFALSEKHALPTIVENYQPNSNGYWLTSKFPKIFKNAPMNQSVTQWNSTNEVPQETTNTESKSLVLSSQNNNVNNQILESENSNIKDNTEQDTMLKKLVTWLTTSEVKHKKADSDSDDEEIGIVRMGKAAYNWSTTKKVNIDSKDIHMMSPNSL